MYLFFLILLSITLFWIEPVEKCSTPYISDNLQIKSCYYKDSFTVKYSTEYFDLISGETGRSGKHVSIFKATNEGLNDLYNKNTIGYNCKHLQELYKGYKVRYCYFYPNNTKAWKVIVSKSGLLTEGISVSTFVDNKSIELAIKDYSIKERSRVCY